MMHKDLFSDGVARIDPDAVERLLQIEQSMQAKQKRQRRARLLVIPAVALVALLVCITVAVIPFIPKTYDLDYGEAALIEEKLFSNHKSVWVYYVNDKGTQKRERVRIPSSTDNVFLTWKHLNTVGDEVKILNYEYQENIDVMQPAVEPDTLWEFLQQQISPASKSVTVTLSPQITSYDNYDALIQSLTETLAKYAGVSPEQVKILIGEQIGDTYRGVHFWHSLQSESVVVGVGSTLEITVGVTNISEQDIVLSEQWSPFFPTAVLTMNDTAIIAHEEIGILDDRTAFVLAPGNSVEYTYTFPIPEHAVTGKYDLLVTFGQSSRVFEDAVHVVEFSVPAIGTISSTYKDYLKAYGLDTTDPAAFKSAIQALSYNGVGLFELMNQADVDWMPGYSGEMYDSEHFGYKHSAFSPDRVSKSHTNTFTATVLPDGMTLPLGISPEEGVIEALCKLGISEQSAENALAQRTTYLIADSILSSTFVVTVSFDTTGIEISYKYGAHRVDIRYDENGQHFEMLRIQTASSAIEDAQIVFTSFTYEEFEYVLSAQRCGQFFQMLERADKMWDVAELICDSSGSCNGIPFSYDSESGTLIMDGVTYSLTEQDRFALNTMVGGSVFIYFDPDAKVEVDSPYDDLEHYATLSSADRDRIIAILTGGEWKSGQPDIICDYTFTVLSPNASTKAVLRYSFEAGIFVYDGHYRSIADADRIIVNEIFEGYAAQMPCT